MDKKEMKTLIKKARQGDSRAFGLLYSEIRIELFRFALYVLKNSSDAEDAVQSASISAFRKIGMLKKEDSFKSWYFKILFNECKNLLSEKSRKYELPQEDMTLFFRDEASFEGNFFVKEMLSSFSHEDRSVIVLSVLEGYSSKEIGEILGMNPATVRSKLSRLLIKLRKMTEGEENE